MKKILILPDLHAPFHSEEAYGLFLKCAKLINPDILVIIGDFADFHGVSRYPAPPEPTSFMEEVMEVNRQLDRLEGIGKRKIFLCGNHEKRLESYLIRNAPELYGMLTVEDLLELKRRKYEYHPYHQPVEIGKLYLVHDTGYAGKNALRQTLGDMQGNVVTGHTHHFGDIIEGNLRGESHLSASYGWLGSTDEIDYLSKPKVMRDWQNGFGYGYLLPNGNAHMVPVPFIEGAAMFEGQVVK